MLILHKSKNTIPNTAVDNFVSSLVDNQINLIKINIQYFDLEGNIG